MNIIDRNRRATKAAQAEQHVPSYKADQDKLRADLVLDGFSLALTAVAEVATFGAKKYTPNGWASVPNGQQRYRGAGDRHRLARARELHDSESKLPHLAHEAWNRLAELELYLQSFAGCQPVTPDAVPEPTTTEKSVLREPVTDTSQRLPT